MLLVAMRHIRDMCSKSLNGDLCTFIKLCNWCISTTLHFTTYRSRRMPLALLLMTF